MFQKEEGNYKETKKEQMHWVRGRSDTGSKEYRNRMQQDSKIHQLSKTWTFRVRRSL